MPRPPLLLSHSFDCVYFLNQFLCGRQIQPVFTSKNCLCRCKGTNFLANHNYGKDNLFARVRKGHKKSHRLW